MQSSLGAIMQASKAPLDYYAWVGAFTGGMLLLIIAPDFVMGALQGKFDLSKLQQGIQQKAAQAQAIAGGSGEDSFTAFYEFSRRWEGGYSNHPADAGGSTQNGVTQGTYDSYRSGKGLSKQDVKQIAPDEVKGIYRARWNAGKCGSYAAPLSIVCGDTWVNFNPDANHAGWFFRDLNISDPKAAALEVVKRRMDYRRQRAGEKASQRDFLEGWLNRDRDLEKLVRSVSP
jgi:Glycosyl hydrolase 108